MVQSTDIARREISNLSTEIVRREMVSFKAELTLQFQQNMQQQSRQHAEALNAIRTEQAMVKASVESNATKSDATFAMLKAQGDATVALLQKLLDGQGLRGLQSADL